MKLRGGYNIQVCGRPGATVETPPEPRELCLPLVTRRFNFVAEVVDGQRVVRGQVLGRDAAAHGLPLLAPCGGVVHLDRAAGCVVLTDLSADERLASPAPAPAPAAATAAGSDLHAPQHAARLSDSTVTLRHKLLNMGAWQFVSDACSGAVAAPFDVPQAVIVSTMRAEPFAARGDVQLAGAMQQFTRGLEHLQSLLEYQPIYLVLPRGSSALGEEVRGAVRGYAFVRTVEIPRKYPLDNFAVLARGLGLKLRGEAPVWGLYVEGVLAVDRALTASRPVDRRTISIGGPAALKPTHISLLPGYPLRELLKGRLDESRGPVRIISGGLLTGHTVGQWPLQGQDSDVAVDSETSGLTLVYEQSEREFLSFMRPGGDRGSYSGCFLSALRAPRKEHLTTGLRGERRACVTCGFCEEVCPAGLMPHMLHKLLFQDDLESAAKARIDLCVSCGLCSYVCPSKIDLAQEFQTARAAIAEEQRLQRELKAKQEQELQEAAK